MLGYGGEILCDDEKNEKPLPTDMTVDYVSHESFQ